MDGLPEIILTALVLSRPRGRTRRFGVRRQKESDAFWEDS